MRIFFYLTFTLCSFTVFGQEMYWEKPARFVTSFPFKQLNGGVMLVKARFGDIKDTFNFILDTGSGGISLDSTTAANYHISHEPSGRYIYGIAGVRKVDYAPHQTLNFPGLSVDSLDFYINNYEVLTSVYGMKIDGIIGHSFLSRYLVKVDFDSLRISVFSPGFINYPPHGFLLRPAFQGLPIVPLTIMDSRKLNAHYFFDTGAGLCLLLSTHYNEDSSVLMKKRKPVEIEVQGMGGKKRMQLTIIRELQVGNYKFRKVPTYLFDDEYNVLAYPQRAGLIGNDILRHFNLIINYPQKEIYLTPNSHFRDPFDYSYTGLTMYSLDGSIIVDDIVKASPADKAGLKNGDVIMGVDNNFSGNLETYKNLLQKTGYRISILVMRENKPFILSLRVGRIK
ncbi:MAG TPA: aspartyl protease family protein [Hanamia sp.]|nr:aspartyl protease family protein [Hanamia sp.]